MTIPPLSIEQDGPGIDLSEQPDGVAVQMSDPVTDGGMVNRELRIGNLEEEEEEEEGSDQ